MKKAVCEYTSVKIWDRNFSADIIPSMMGYLGYAKNYQVLEVLKNIHQNTNIKVKLYYGSKDWLDFRNFQSEIEKLGLTKFQLNILDGIGHQVPNLIPKKLTSMVVNDFKNFGI